MVRRENCHMNIKLTGKEKRWIMYDVGNSAFTLLVSTIIPIYFNYMAGKADISSVNYLAYWGYAASICPFIVSTEFCKNLSVSSSLCCAFTLSV
jgi:MFS-type transporter involved in bile tolerance (Atg22 family)